MDIEKKIQILRACSSKKGNRCSSCPAFGQGDRNCIRNAMKDAATALSTLQGENKQLRGELEYEQEHANAYHEECGQWEAENEKLRGELEKVKQKYDEAREAICTHCMDVPCRGESCYWWRGQKES